MSEHTEPQTPPSATTTGTSRVAVLYTRPENVLDDIGRLMELTGYAESFSREAATALKINISWQHWYPACSTSPWQLEGVIRKLQADGFADLVPAQNGTVVVDPHEGERNNKHDAVLQKYGLDSVFLGEPPVEWVPYHPQAEMLVLDGIFPEGLRIPDALIGRNVVHLPTVKTHVFTTTTGAMKNAFGGLLNYKRHWTHAVIHETLVDLLAIQKEIHPGLLAVMDGTLAGDGPGPRAMRVHQKNVILASTDQVAIDAVVAKMMGFDPLSLGYIRLAHERGLGCGDVKAIEVVGADIEEVNWRFSGGEDTFASRGQKAIYWGPLKPLERVLLRSFIAPWSYLASNLYFNTFWYRFHGRRRVRQALETDWGRLFQSY